MVVSLGDRALCHGNNRWERSLKRVIVHMAGGHSHDACMRRWMLGLVLEIDVGVVQLM